MIQVGIDVTKEYIGDEKHKTTLVHKKCFRKKFHTRRYRGIGLKDRVNIFKRTWSGKDGNNSSA